MRPSSLPRPGDDRAVVGAAAVTVQLDPVVDDPLDVVERVRPVRVAGELDEAPDLVLGRIGPRHRLELALEPLLLARNARAVQQRQALEPAQPLPQPALCLTRQRAAGAGPGTAAARSRGRIASIWPKRRFCSALPKSSGSFSLMIDWTTRGPVNASSAPGSAIVTSPSEAKLAMHAAGRRVRSSTPNSGSRASCSSSIARDHLRQLHQREDPLLHARAARARREEQRRTPVDRRVAGARELLADGAPHRAAHEGEVHHRELERHARRASRGRSPSRRGGPC